MKSRIHPRVSLFPLAEYVEASAARRWAIVEAAANPPDEIVPLYRQARASARAYLRTAATDPSMLEATIDELESTEPSSKWQKQDLANSAEALRRLRQLEGLNLGERILQTRESGILLVEGVQVSVSPAIAFIDGDRVGAVKLTWRKTRSLPEVEAAHVATTLRVFIRVHLEGLPQDVAPELCQVVDIWRGEIFTAPKAFKRRMTKISANCKEIARQWPSRPWDTPPADPGTYPPANH